MKIAAVIPARYASSRFPGKPLARMRGKPMIQHVYEHAAACSTIDRVIVACDDTRIQDAVRGFGGESMMTSGSHQTGTDRVAEAARSIEAEIIVNIQGDEPLLPPEAVAAAIQPLENNPDVCMATLKTALRAGDDPDDVNIVKVVTDTNGRALYFSRSAIPCARCADSSAALFRHIGLYAFRRDFLFQFSELPQTPLELAESLEQLRVLEHGYSIYVTLTDYYPISVDVPADVARAEDAMRKLN